MSKKSGLILKLDQLHSFMKWDIQFQQNNKDSNLYFNISQDNLSNTMSNSYFMEPQTWHGQKEN